MTTAIVPADRAGERILDAALGLAAASGLRHLTMDGVARRAGVGRMTVYRRFGDRERLLQALEERETGRLLAALDAAADPGDPIEEQVAAGFVAAVGVVRRHPLLSRVASSDPESALQALRADESALFRTCRDYLAARLQAAGVARAEHAAELVVRICVSFVLVEESALPLDDPGALRDLALALVVPVVQTRAP
jgi:AcrR family transcriptional regulator